MTVKTAQPCGCLEPIYQGKKARRECEHGNPFLGKQLGSVGVGVGNRTRADEVGGPDRSASPARPGVDSSTPRRRSLKRSEPKRDWTLAQAKVEDEGEFCRVCGAIEVEKAHILGRKYDQPISPGSKTLLVLPDRIVPLCGEWANRCHQRYDAHELDLLPYLTTAEQAQAILDAGSIGLALQRINPASEREAA